MTRLHSRPRGFTLIEIMVALTIFALMSGVAYRGLDAVLNARARVAQEAAQWRDLALAFANMQQSLSAVVDRPIRDRGGLIAAPFIGTASARSEEDVPLVFTRMGFPDHGGALGDLQRTGYRVAGGRLEQVMWPVLDLAPGSEPTVVELAPGVAGMGLRFLSKAGSWTASWPIPGDDSVAPVAVELSLRLAGGEQLTRLFVLR